MQLDQKTLEHVVALLNKSIEIERLSRDTARKNNLSQSTLMHGDRAQALIEITTTIKGLK